MQFHPFETQTLVSGSFDKYVRFMFSHVAPGEGIHIHLSLVFSFIFFITLPVWVMLLFFSSKESRFSCGQDIVFFTFFSRVANALTIWTDIFCARCLPAPNQIFFLFGLMAFSSLGTCHCLFLWKFAQILPASKARVEAWGTLKSQFSASSLYRHSQRVMDCLLWLQPGHAGKWFVSAHLDYSVAARSCKSCQPKNSLSVLPSQWNNFQILFYHHDFLTLIF